MKTAAQHDSKWELIMAESTKNSERRDNHHRCFAMRTQLCARDGKHSASRVQALERAA